MKQFQFSLNTVLGVRSNEEQLAAKGHATAQEALEAILMQRQLVEEAIQSNLAACQQAFDGQVKSGTIAHLQAALRELRAQLEAFIPELQRLQAEADAKWQELLQARQRREALEKLKNKQHSVHLKHEVHTEQQAIDEMVLLREAAGHNQKL
jgi:flagellar export protein FliJ